VTRIGFIVGCLCLSLLGAAASEASDVEVEATGESRSTREDAIRRAQRLAIEKAAGVFLLSEAEVENFRLKKERVFARSEGYITQFVVLEETKKQNAYSIKIRAKVSMKKIKNDLLAMKILLDSMQRPTVAVLVAEDCQGIGGSGMHVAQTEITSLFKSKGFDLVDAARGNADRHLKEIREALAGDTGAVRHLGMESGAQYVITGRATAQDRGEIFSGTGLRSVHAVLELSIVQTQTGLVLGSVVETAATAHINPLSGATAALKETAKKAVEEYLLDAIASSFQDFINNGAAVHVYVDNVFRFEDCQRLIAFIQSLERVVSGKRERWGQESGRLVMDLRFLGGSEELAGMLDRRRIGNTHVVEVMEVRPEKVECRLSTIP